MHLAAASAFATSVNTLPPIDFADTCDIDTSLLIAGDAVREAPPSPPTTAPLSQPLTPPPTVTNDAPLLLAAGPRATQPTSPICAVPPSAVSPRAVRAKLHAGMASPTVAPSKSTSQRSPELESLALQPSGPTATSSPPLNTARGRSAFGAAAPRTAVASVSGPGADAGVAPAALRAVIPSADAAGAGTATATPPAWEGQPLQARLAAKAAGARRSALLELATLADPLSSSGAPPTAATAAAPPDDDVLALITPTLLKACLGDSAILVVDAAVALLAAALRRRPATPAPLPSLLPTHGAGGEALRPAEAAATLVETLLPILLAKPLVGTRGVDAALDATAALLLYPSSTAAAASGSGAKAGAAVARGVASLVEVARGSGSARARAAVAATRALARFAVAAPPTLVAEAALQTALAPLADAATTPIVSLLMSTDRTARDAAVELASALGGRVRGRVGAGVRDLLGAAAAAKREPPLPPDLAAALSAAVQGAGSDAAPTTGGATAVSNSIAASDDASVAAAPAVVSAATTAAATRAALEDAEDAAFAAAAPIVLPRAATDADALELAFSSKKWSERAEGAAAIARAVAGAGPRLVQPADGGAALGDVLGLLRRGLRDANAVVVARCIEAHAAFASRLRGGFRAGAAAVLPLLLEKLKEKRGPVVAAATATALALPRYGCIDADDVFAEASPLLRGGGSESGAAASAQPLAGLARNPDARRNAVALLGAIVESTRALPPARLAGTGRDVHARVASLAAPLFAAVGDAAADVRGEAERAVAALLRRLREAGSGGGGGAGAETSHAAIAPLWATLSERSAAAAGRIRHAVAGVETGSVTAPVTITAAPAGPPSAAAAQPPRSESLAAAAASASAPAAAAAPRGRSAQASARSGSTQAQAGPRPGRAASASARSAPSSAASGAAAAAAPSGGTAAADLEDGEVEPSSPQLPDADDVAASIIAGELRLAGVEPGATATALLSALDRSAGAKWSEKVASLRALGAGAAASCATPSVVNSVVGFIAQRMAREANAVVRAAAAAAVAVAAAAGRPAVLLSRRAAAAAIDAFAGDLKERRNADAVAMCAALAGAVGPSWVTARLCSMAQKQGRPPALAAAVSDAFIAAVAIPRFGIGRLRLPALLLHLTGDAAGVGCTAQPAVRAAALSALVALHAQVGPPLLEALPRKPLSLAPKLVEVVTAAMAEAVAAGRGVYSTATARAALEAAEAVAGETAPPYVRLHGEAAPPAAASGGAAAAAPMALTLLGGAPAAPSDALAVLPRGALLDLDAGLAGGPASADATATAAPAAKGAADDAVRPAWQTRLDAAAAITAALVELHAGGGTIVVR